MKKQKINKTKNRPEQPIEKYLKEIGFFSPLLQDEEAELTRRIRKGDSAALDKLVKANLRFVISVAKGYQGQGLSLQDLVSEGNLGLIKAAQKFDETRRFKFITYAVWWIRQSILEALTEVRPVRLPLNRVADITKFNRAVGALKQKLGREPGAQEVAGYLGVTAEEAAKILKISARSLSLDESLPDGGGRSLLDVLESDRYAPPDDSLMQESLKEEIDKVLVTLKPREAEIIRLYFGLEGDRPLTLEEIGEHFKLTRERIRQIKAKALGRMQVKSRQEALRKYLG